MAEGFLKIETKTENPDSQTQAAAWRFSVPLPPFSLQKEKKNQLTNDSQIRVNNNKKKQGAQPVWLSG